jgi:Spy/CpxP family protein refolding chaperone
MTFLVPGPAFAGAHKSAGTDTSARPGGGYGAMYGGGHRGGPDGMGMMPRMGEKLGLTDPQMQELASLMEIYRPRFSELRERGEANRKQLLAMAPDDPGYSALTDAVSEEAGRTAAELVVLMAELQANAYGLLTDEQQAKYLELRVSMRERMQERRAAMGEGGGKKGRHRAHHGGHHARHGEDHVCEQGKDGVCPHRPQADDAKPDD